MPEPGLQAPTDDLRQWIRARLAAGGKPAELLGAMQASGWAEPVARRTIEEVAPGMATSAEIPIGGKVPAPALPDGVGAIDLDGHQVQLRMAMRHPGLWVLGGLLSDQECDALIAQAEPRLARSETVDVASGASEVNEARTSRGMFFLRGETPLVQRIEERIARLLNWPLEWGEGMQVLHYGPGAEYRPHHDYFDPRHEGTAAVLARGGQRVGTLVVYLNTPVRGGATSFPDVMLEVAAVKGDAVFFNYDRPHPVTRTLHGGAPVREGEKWVATKWLREREFK